MRAGALGPSCALPPALGAQDGPPAVQRMALPSLGSRGELCASFSPSSSAPKCKDSGHHCQGTCLSLTLCKAGAAAPCAVREQHQRSEGPLGHRGSGAVNLALDLLCCLIPGVSPRPPLQPWSRWRGRAGDSPRETPTQYKPQRVNNYGCDCSGTSSSPGL